jgi:hypothetical protein
MRAVLGPRGGPVLPYLRLSAEDASIRSDGWRSRATVNTIHVLSATSSDLTKNDVFIALVTVEGLLFAALSISATLASGSKFGAPTWGPPWVLAVASAIVLIVVAVAVLLAWIDLFTGHAWPHHSDRQIEAIGLLVAIVAQPTLAAVIAVGVVKG